LQPCARQIGNQDRSFPIGSGIVNGFAVDGHYGGFHELRHLAGGEDIPPAGTITLDPRRTFHGLNRVDGNEPTSNTFSEKHKR
jgi:hypothetical protein